MNFKDMSDVDIISLQYSLLEELKQKKSTKAPIITAEIITNPLTDNWKDFIKQTFKDEDGNLESPYNHLNRMRWFEMGCPSYKKLSEQFGLNHPSIRKTASRFKWRKILSEAISLGYRAESAHRFIDDSEVKRNSKEYNRYHEKVLKRDKVCQCCGKSKDLEVHHPLPFNQYQSMGADTNNGIVLCKECHSQYHSDYGYKRNANPITLAQFLRDYGMTTQSTLEAEHD